MGDLGNGRRFKEDAREMPGEELEGPRGIGKTRGGPPEMSRLPELLSSPPGFLLDFLELLQMTDDKG